MRSSKGQLTAVFILILALFLHMEGFLPNIFADEEEPIVLVKENQGIEFLASFDRSSFTKNKEVQLRVSYTNRSKQSIGYFLDANTELLQTGADIVAIDGCARFTHRLTMGDRVSNSDTTLIERTLLPGKTQNCDFQFMPYYKQNGVIQNVQPGKYLLKLWYTKTDGEKIETVFPITIVKRFGTMYIKAV